MGLTLLAQNPDALTPSTRRAVERQIELYFSTSGPVSDELFTLALFLIQGPFLLVIFAGVIGVRIGNRVVSRLIDSGQFELLLSAPYDVREVFISVLATSVILTAMGLGVFAAISIGGPLVFLAANGLLPTGGVDGLLLIGFLLPVPFTLWANLVVIVGATGIAPGPLADANDVLNIFGLAPGILLVLFINLRPNVNVIHLSVASLLVAVLAVAGCLYWLTRSFDVEQVLPN
ncbi:hypothetical protein BRC83_03485 [Halobacteriales archaeon QS_1_68_17]|nr:MAG: hypothetical protein BRC83_03485 [Halobacteriales archaeon QS_1_68_17]